MPSPILPTLRSSSPSRQNQALSNSDDRKRPAHMPGRSEAIEGKPSSSAGNKRVKTSPSPHPEGLFDLTNTLENTYNDSENVMSPLSDGELEPIGMREGRNLFISALAGQYDNKVLTHIALKQSKVGLFADAKKSVDMISPKEAFEKVDTLISVAEAEHKADKKEQAQATLQKAFLIASDPEHEFPADDDIEHVFDLDDAQDLSRIAALHEIAVTQSKLGFFADAIASYDNAELLEKKEYRDLDNDIGSARDLVFHRLKWYPQKAILNHNLGRENASREYFEKIISNAQNLTLVVRCSEADARFNPTKLLMRAAQEQHNFGHADLLPETFRATENFLEDYIGSFYDAGLLASDGYIEVAKKKASLNFVHLAKASFTKAMEAIYIKNWQNHSVGDNTSISPEVQARQYIKIALAEQLSGLHAEAESALNLARALVPNNSFSSLYNNVCMLNSCALAKNRSYDHALTSISEVNESTYKIRLRGFGSFYLSFYKKILQAKISPDITLRQSLLASAAEEVFKLIDPNDQREQFNQLAKVASAQAQSLLIEDAQATIDKMLELGIVGNSNKYQDQEKSSLAHAQADLAAALMQSFHKQPSALQPAIAGRGYAKGT